MCASIVQMHVESSARDWVSLCVNVQNQSADVLGDFESQTFFLGYNCSNYVNTNPILF